MLAKEDGGLLCSLAAALYVGEKVEVALPVDLQAGFSVGCLFFAE